MKLLKFNRIYNIIKQPFEVVFLRYLSVGIVAFILLMLISWWLSPKTRVDLFILNKSVPDIQSQSKNTMYWILNNERVTKPDGSIYSQAADYYGYHPMEDSSFTIKDINTFTPRQLDSLVNKIDAAYIADTYGIYGKEYDSSGSGQLIYGGLKSIEVDLLEALREQSKLIIAEFNILDAPTYSRVSKRFQKEFDIRWSGWIGRYFDSLDSSGVSEIPYWALELHREKTGAPWPYKRSGIILVNNANQLIVLESGDLLKHETPTIRTHAFYRQKFGLPEQVPYTSWFEISYSPARDNKLISSFHIPLTAAGDSLFSSMGLSPVFPAVLGREGFYYLAGSFSENKVPMGSSYFKGIHWFQTFFHKSKDVLDTRTFFWEYYRPLLSSILQELKK